MPIISDKFNFLYVCTPGTGSTSYSNFFLDYANARWLPQHDIFLPNNEKVDYKHASIQELLDCNLINASELSKYYKFTFTRNPYSWLLSDYKRHKNWIILLDDPNSWIHSDPESVKRVQLAQNEDFYNYVKQRVKPGDIFGKYVEGCDEVFRIEDIKTGKAEGPKVKLNTLDWSMLQYANKTVGNTQLKDNEELFATCVINLISERCYETFEKYKYPINFKKACKYF